MKSTFKALSFGLIVVLFIMRPGLSYADWNSHNGGSNHGTWSGHGGGYHHDHSYVGVNLSLWPDSYYYGAPYYPPSDEVLVSPPAYEPVAVNGTTYYLNDGTYYVYNGYNYQAVAPPATVVQPPVTVVQAPAAADSQVQDAPVAITAPAATSDTVDVITINIPNDKGGFTAVTLKKSGNGFIGPQGEFYPEFPKVSQLKIIYGK